MNRTTLLQRVLLVAPLALALLAAIACTSDDPAPTPTPTTETTPTTVPAATGTPVPTATTRAPFILQTPTPFPTPEAMAPDRILETNARRTGQPEVDGVLDALFGGDQAAVGALVRTQSAVCHEEPLGLGDLEVCPEGVEAGSLVEFFPAGSCHGYPLHERPFVRPLDPERRALFAVLRLPEPETRYESWPAGEFLVVILDRELQPPRNGSAYYLEGGQLVRFQAGCNTVDALLARGGEAPDYLLEPFVLPEVGTP